MHHVKYLEVKETTAITYSTNPLVYDDIVVALLVVRAIVAYYQNFVVLVAARVEEKT